jgi:hypothetical protein
MPLPRTACQFVELFPIAFVPSRSHSQSRANPLMRFVAGRCFPRTNPRLVVYTVFPQKRRLREMTHTLRIPQANVGKKNSWPDVSNPATNKMFRKRTVEPSLSYETRQSSQRACGEEKTRDAPDTTIKKIGKPEKIIWACEYLRSELHGRRRNKPSEKGGSEQGSD